jgi:hypothetical protein
MMQFQKNILAVYCFNLMGRCHHTKGVVWLMWSWMSCTEFVFSVICIIYVRIFSLVFKIISVLNGILCYHISVCS